MSEACGPSGFKLMARFEFSNGNGIAHEFAACSSSLELRLSLERQYPCLLTDLSCDPEQPGFCSHGECPFGALGQGGCLLSFPVDRLGVVISRVWCASLPCPQLDTGRRDWLALVDFKLHHCRFRISPGDEISSAILKETLLARFARYAVVTSLDQIHLRLSCSPFICAKSKNPT